MASTLEYYPLSPSRAPLLFVVHEPSADSCSLSPDASRQAKRNLLPTIRGNRAKSQRKSLRISFLYHESKGVSDASSSILHNDWETSVTRVVWVLVQVIPGMKVKKVTKVMWEAHTKGRAVAKTCRRELAALYEERLREKGLTVSTEPAR
jgi:ATP-dependent Clp protease adaptor protein ClpS